MPLRIGCDVDGTLADMDSALQETAEALFGPAVDVRAGATPGGDPPAEADLADADLGDGTRQEPAPQNVRRALSNREYRRLWSHVRTVDNFWASLTETSPGVVARLAAAAQERGWDIIFLTQRPSTSGDTAQRQTQRWLMEHGFDLPSVFVTRGSRGHIAASLHLDAVVDDRLENCLDLATDSTTLPVLVWSADRGPVPSGTERMRIRAVGSVDEALGELLQLSDARESERRGTLRRLRRTLGI